MHQPKRRAQSRWLWDWLIPVLVFLLTLAAFLPVLENGFVFWDDDRNLLNNPNYRGLGWSQLRWMFSTYYMSLYRPMTWASFGFDYLFWGTEPLGYHLTSLLLHAANAVLVYFLALRLLALSFYGHLSSEEPIVRAGAGLAALLFALHPLRVEAVAWASARGDLLAGLFSLWAVLCYLRYATLSGTVRTWWLAGSLLIYALCLLSKASAITLPVVFLILDFYPLRRLGDGLKAWLSPGRCTVWLEKIPFLVLALAAAVIALLAKERSGVTKSFAEYGIFPRLAQSFYGLVFYLWKTILPTGLSPLYELPQHLDPWSWDFLLSGAAVAAVTIGVIVARRRWPGGLALWSCYVVILAPVLGLTQSGPQLVADRYTYLSCLGWAVLAGAALIHCRRLWVSTKIGNVTLMIVLMMAAMLPVGFGALSWTYAGVWHNSETLWTRVLTVTGHSKIAHNNLGHILARRGELEAAMSHLHEALRIDPDYGEAHTNLGFALISRGEIDGAITHFREALRINPHYSESHFNLGVALARRGKLEEAIKHYREALRIDPADVQVHNNLGNALARQGDFEAAVGHLREALRVDSSNALVHVNLGNVLARTGQLEVAAGHFREAVRIQPELAEARQNLARVLAELGKRDEAIKHYEEALRILKSRGP